MVYFGKEGNVFLRYIFSRTQEPIHHRPSSCREIWIQQVTILFYFFRPLIILQPNTKIAKILEAIKQSIGSSMQPYGDRSCFIFAMQFSYGNLQILFKIIHPSWKDELFYISTWSFQAHPKKNDKARRWWV
jgi:hypothetical protein